MDDLIGFQRDLLVVAAGLEEPNGLDIKSELEQYYTSEINHGRLYPNLNTLVEKGLVEKGQKDERTNQYVVTDRGDGNSTPVATGRTTTSRPPTTNRRSPRTEAVPFADNDGRLTTPLR